MKRNRLFTGLVGMVMVAALATPASAGLETGVVLLVSGSATVGNSIGGGNIPHDGRCNPTGKGLTFPWVTQFKQTDKPPVPLVVNKEVYFRINQVTTSLLIDTNNAAENGEYAGPLNVCGIVSGGFEGIGAACGSSSGHNGRGRYVATKVDDTEVVRVFQLQKVGWRNQLLAVLPVHGQIQRISADKRTKYSAKGALSGLIRAGDAATAAACAAGKTGPMSGGATSFPTSGIIRAVALGKAPGGKPYQTKLTKYKT